MTRLYLAINDEASFEKHMNGMDVHVFLTLDDAEDWIAMQLDFGDWVVAETTVDVQVISALGQRVI